MAESSSLFLRSSEVIHAASWMDLHPPLLEMILDRLSISDYLRFAAVCRLWRDINHNHRLFRPSRYLGQIPWLISEKKELFYNPSEQRYYRISVTKGVQGKICCGVSYSWLLFLDNISKREKTSPNNLSLLLLNPFTGSKIHIPICQNMLSTFISGGYHPARCSLSSEPTNPDCVVLFGQYDRRPRTHFLYNFRNKTWTSVHAHQSPGLRNPVYYGGTFYWLFGGELKFVESLHNTPTIKDLDFYMDPFPGTMFLVESDGRLLLVRYAWGSRYSFKKFEIFNVDLANRVLIKLDSLGDHVLFCNMDNKDYTFSLPAAATGRPRNRIYMTGPPSFLEYTKVYQGQLWIEYDYASHLVINTRLSNSMSNMDDAFCWIMPSL